VLNAIQKEIVRTGQEHRRKMGVGKSRGLESEELLIFGHGLGDLVVDRAAAGKELFGEPSPQIGKFVEWFGHKETLPEQFPESSGIRIYVDHSLVR
jgi:hypothetical protein